MEDKPRITGKQATQVAQGSENRGSIGLLAPEGVEEAQGVLVPTDGAEQGRKAPPRVLKPSKFHDQCLAPTADLESHRQRLREALGKTMSDEFVNLLLGKLVEALRPGAIQTLEESTLNAALAIIESMHPQSELEALLAVEVVGVGFSGLRLLRQCQQFMTAEFIDTYGSYALKLLRLQNDMLNTFERFRRGNKQTVEIRHVHIHSGGQGLVGIVNAPGNGEGAGQE